MIKKKIKSTKKQHKRGNDFTAGNDFCEAWILVWEWRVMACLEFKIWARVYRLRCSQALKYVLYITYCIL